MKPVIYGGKYTNATVYGDRLKQGGATEDQIKTFINHPAFTNPVYVMPDKHYGKGAVIGFTMEMTDKIIPNIIGVN